MTANYCKLRLNGFQIVTDRWTLRLPGVISHHDDGNYTCVVSNEHGLLQHTVALQIIGRPTATRCIRRRSFSTNFYTLFQKVVHQAHIDTLVNSQRIFKIPSLSHSLENLQ